MGQVRQFLKVYLFFMNKTYNNLFKNGFTLIESILYVSVVSVIVLVISMFFLTLKKSEIKNQAIAEVEQQGVMVMLILEQIIRNSEGINSPTVGNSSQSLSMNVVDSDDDPTVFSVTDNVFGIKRGSGEVVPITSPSVSVSNVVFENLSKNETNGLIRIEFKLSYTGDELRNEYEYSKFFYGSSSLRFNN